MYKTKEHKSFRETFHYYDYTAIQEYLEEKALEGWLLVRRPSGGVWEFESIEPQKLHYAVTYQPKYSNEDEFLLSDSKNEYLEICKEQGWHFACAYKDMLIFYSEEEEPVQFQTDPEVELAYIHKSVMKRIVPGVIISFVVAAISVVNLFISALNDVLVCAMLIISVAVIMDFFSYLRWHKKALAAASLGESSKSGTDGKAVGVLLAVFTVVAAFICIYKSVKLQNWEQLTVLGIGSVYVLGCILLDKFKKKLSSDWQKRVTTFFSILLYVAFIACLNILLD